MAIEPGPTLLGFGLAAYEITMIVIMLRLGRRNRRPRRWPLSQRTMQMRSVLAVAFVAVGLGGIGLVSIAWRNFIFGAAGIVLLVVVLGDWVTRIVRAVRRRHVPLPSPARSGYPDWTGGLKPLRVVFASLFLSLFLFLLMLTFIAPRSDGEADPIWIPLFVGAYGAVSVALVRWTMMRPLDVRSARTVAGSYVSTVWLGIGLAQSPALFGFVSVFITGDLWLYVEGLVFATLDMVLIAPTRRNIDRRQRRIEADGSSVSLLEALMATPFQGRDKDRS
ncbi:MAG TPA: hypothetical protein VGL18_03260 [Actinomycetota bacterium]|jgi:MFS family permease